MAIVPPRTPRDMTARLREIEQRLPRRKQPSLPAVAIEGVRKQRARVDAPQPGRIRPAGRKLTETEQERWIGTTDDAGFQTDGQRVWVEENLDVGAGATRDGTRARMLCTAEAMHRAGTIDSDHWQAAYDFRLRLLRQLGNSEGVGTYGQHPGGADPATRSDRRGRALTGFEIDTNNGTVQVNSTAFAAARRNRDERRETALMMYAAVGVETTEGRRVFDPVRALVLVQSVLQNPTLDQIGNMLTAYGTRSKQKAPAAGSILREMYHRMAQHIGLKKGEAWTDGVPSFVANAATR